MTRRFLPLWLVLGIAIGLLAFLNVRRIERVEYVTALGGEPSAAASAAAPSAISREHPWRHLIVPERHEAAASRIAETQRSLLRGEARVRWTDQDNAPVGRAVLTSSPARWWLALVSRAGVANTSPRGPESCARAALVSEPLLHLLLLVGFTAFCAWRFGALAAIGFAAGAVTMFPFAASFLPGVPDGRGLAIGCALGSLFAAMAALREVGQARRWLIASGVCGGIGLWVDPRSQVIVLAGLAVGGLLGQWTGRRSDAPVFERTAWRLWSLAGAVTSVTGYLVEYAPAHLGGWELRANHPLYALVWLGVGELLARAGSEPVGIRPRNWLRGAQTLVLAAAVVGLFPLALKLTNSRSFLDEDLSVHRLTSLPGSVVAASFGEWLQRDGLSLAIGSTILPIGIVAVIGWALARNRIEPTWRPAVAFTLGPVIVAVVFAWRWLDAWILVDGALLVALVAGLAATWGGRSRPLRLAWGVVVAGIAFSGVMAAWPECARPEMVLTRAEAELLMERHLAHWLAARAGEPGSIVYAPPQVTASLGYFGGFRGLGTLAAGNEDGLGLSLAIAGARTIEEVQWALQSRGVRYVVVPSWDPFFDEFARVYLVKEHATRVSFFARELRRWHLPAWLRPIAYSPPVIQGMDTPSALIFEVVEEQTAALASSRLTEFLVETGRLDDASEVAAALRRFPGDLGALTARAQIQAAQGDSAGFAQTIAAIRMRLANQADRYLAWDRRVGLAAVLAQANELELARAQARRCMAEADAHRLRMLNEGALYRLLVLGDAFELPLPDPQLRTLTESLLSEELRQQL